MKSILTTSIGVFAILFCFACQNTPKEAAKTESTAAPAPAYTLATDTDLVCEMKVDATVEDTAHYNGKIYGFCGPDCKQTFKENPAKYAGK